MATWAARPITVVVMAEATRAVMVLKMSPGSEERSEPKMRSTSRVPWEGAWLWLCR